MSDNSGSKTPSPVTLLMLGVAILLVFVALFFLLMQESPQSVVQQFFNASNMAEKKMYITPDSSVWFENALEESARYYRRSVSELKRMVDMNERKLKAITGVQKLSDDRYIISVTLNAKDDETEDIETQIPVVKIGSAWKIDLTELKSLKIFI